MGKPTKSSVEHKGTRDDGLIGCFPAHCNAPATWWEDWEHNNVKRFVSTAYCDKHRTGPNFPDGQGLSERPVRQPDPRTAASTTTAP